MPRESSAVALAAALIALCATQTLAETPVELAPEPEWVPDDDIRAITATLNDWLDANSEWSRPEAEPRIRIVGEWEAKARQGVTASFQRGPLRGLYDPETAEIFLVAPWSPRSASDVSVLLHELVHHRQAQHHWYCPAAQELPAYRLQDAWLSERGMQAKVNWIAVVLDSGCTRRDIHPD